MCRAVRPSRLRPNTKQVKSSARSLKIQSKPYLVQIHILVETPKEDLNLCSQAHQAISLFSKPQLLALLKLDPKSKYILPHIQFFVHRFTTSSQSYCKLPHIRHSIHRLRKTRSSASSSSPRWMIDEILHHKLYLYQSKPQVSPKHKLNTNT